MALMDKEYFEYRPEQKKDFESLEEMARVLFPNYRYIALNNYKKDKGEKGSVCAFQYRPRRYISYSKVREKYEGYTKEFIDYDNPYISWMAKAKKERTFGGFRIGTRPELRNSLKLGKIYDLKGIANGFNKCKGSL